jgi:chemotaxis protein histidine kinase CheA
MKMARIFLLLVALGSFLLTSCGEKREQASDKGGAKKEDATGGEKEAEEKKAAAEKAAAEKATAEKAAAEKAAAEKAAAEKAAAEKATAEKAAIEAFAKQIADLGIVEDMNTLEELEANAEENPAPLFEAMDALVEKFGEVNTDGLPADLEEGFETMKSGFSDLAEHCRAIPMPLKVLKGGEAAIMAWVTEKMTADPEFLGKFEVEMGAWEKKVEELGSKLEELDGSVFEKYDIELE